MVWHNVFAVLPLRPTVMGRFRSIVHDLIDVELFRFRILTRVPRPKLAWMERSTEPNGAFGFLGRHEMAEQILIGQTCHVASDRSDIGSASESTEEEERRPEKRAN